MTEPKPTRYQNKEVEASCRFVDSNPIDRRHPSEHVLVRFHKNKFNAADKCCLLPLGVGCRASKTQTVLV